LPNVWEAVPLPVLATPVLATLFEGAAAEIAQEFLADGLTTVGTEITVHHTAPTPCGAKITIEAELTEQTDRVFPLPPDGERRSGSDCRRYA
jgi:fluoroacetyl-CoA thioesterase